VGIAHGHRGFGIVTAITITALACGCRRALPAEFHVLATDPMGPYIDLRGISEDGLVVIGNRGFDEPFHWTATGGFEDLEPAPQLPSAPARGLSGDGSTVVGFGCCGGLADGEAFRWTASEGMIPIGGLPTSIDSTAYAASYDGQVVVGDSDSPDGFRPFRWTPSGGFVGLDTLSGERPNGAARAVSRDGNVVVGLGTSPTAGTKEEAFRWTAATGIEWLGDVAGNGLGSAAHDVSGDGLVVVGSGSDNDGERAFRWSSATGIIPLPDAPGGQPFHQADATNGDGSVVAGTSYDDALVWSATGGTRTARDLLISHGLGAELEGLQLTRVIDVSADGRTFAGELILSDGRYAGWVAVVPEPATVVLMLIGVAALGLFRFRQT